MINPIVPQLLSYFGAVLTRVSLWLAPKRPNFWMLYVFASMIYTATMLYCGALAWGLFGVYCIIVGAKNFVENKK